MLARKALAGTAGAPKVYVEDVFSTYLTVGDGTTTTITNNIDLSGKGGLVWLKDRTGAGWHSLGDTERSGKRLFSNDTSAESSSYPFSFTSSGFTANGNLLDSGRNFVSWTFRKAKKFFDVVTYTGNGSNRTISHNLGSVPGCIIVKRTSTAKDWAVYHRSVGNTKYLTLNATSAAATVSTYWNDTDPTSTVFTVGTDGDVNANGETYVAYLFAHDAGGFGDAGSDSIIKCGSFTGFATVNLGWEPQWVLVKATSSASGWYLVDNMRGFSADYTKTVNLLANSSAAEATSTGISIQATGFTNDGIGLSGTEYIYIAIRRGPMKTPTSGTSVYYGLARTGTGAAATITGVGFAPDVVLTTERAKTYDNSTWLSSKLIGTSGFLRTNATVAELTGVTDGITSFGMDGVSAGIDSSWGMINYTSKGYISWFFKRAPGFFDVVCYTGTGSNITINHNLTVVPEMIIGKTRSAAGYNWVVYHKDIGNTGGYPNYLKINSNEGTNSGASNLWGTPTSTTFTWGTNITLNTSGSTYVAYLFASCPGVSKIGTYTGNGSSVTVTTDFQPRFILVKRTDSTGDWLVSDSARGLVAGNDPYIELNTADAEVTNEDWVDISSTSFTVNQTTNNANVNTGTYIYLAIA